MLYMEIKLRKRATQEYKNWKHRYQCKEEIIRNIRAVFLIFCNVSYYSTTPKTTIAHSTVRFDAIDLKIAVVVGNRKDKVTRRILDIS